MIITLCGQLKVMLTCENTYTWNRASALNLPDTDPDTDPDPDIDTGNSGLQMQHLVL